MNLAALHPLSDVRFNIGRAAWKFRLPRPRQAARADVCLVARSLGIDVRVRGMGAVQAVAVGDSLIGTSQPLSRTRGRFVLAHELGHILIHRGLLVAPDGTDEWVADWFARDLLAPLRLLPPDCLVGATVLARRFKIPIAEMRAQLSSQAVLSGLGPERGWPCATCGTRAPMEQCDSSGHS